MIIFIVPFHIRLMDRKHILLVLNKINVVKSVLYYFVSLHFKYMFIWNPFTGLWYTTLILDAYCTYDYEVEKNTGFVNYILSDYHEKGGKNFYRLLRWRDMNTS